jgi:hypothetical protein
MMEQANGLDPTMACHGAEFAGPLDLVVDIATFWMLKSAVEAPRTQFPANEAQIRHIFRDAPGHLADTPANRAILQGLADDARALLGTDRFGNQWFARLNADGTQTWVQSTRPADHVGSGLSKSKRRPPANPWGSAG